MNKRIALLTVVLAAVVLVPASVSAHVLIKDEIGGAGAVLHVTPDDDPVAGEQATLFFDIHDANISQGGSIAKLTIAGEQGAAVAVPSELSGSSVSARYVFPRQGLYEARLVIERDGKPTHEFLQSQRVSRGIIGRGYSPAAHAWAEAGMVFSALAFMALCIIGFNRRTAISNYSK